MPQESTENTHIKLTSFKNLAAQIKLTFTTSLPDIWVYSII